MRVLASFDPGFLSEQARDYLWRHADEPPELQRIRERCEEEGLPVTGPDTGRTLATLAAAAGGGVQGRRPRALEVGTLYGYSALWILRGLGDEGVVDTLEFDDEHADTAESYLDKAGVADRVRVHRGPALDTLPDLGAPYDLVFLDAAKEEYGAYLDHALRVSRPGTLILADNVLWHGRVWDPQDAEESTDAIRGFNQRLREDERLMSTLLPVGDGLSLSVVRPGTR